ncbi:hypothetical protein PRUPE_4G160900 [Prunus persica]|uniref:F-box domain-containing protein n=1 Tax=Prunus persica TaxID=3760 RepID=A0A251PLG0_PRUPE|nr:F-box/LRR-repeat protein At4g14103 [Prunus persica]ONI12387.1 hypothetical protein PRUPE_4G160900 [Prunus persica]
MASNSKPHQACIDEDRISGLPDEVLCHILSFLYTITAVKTCVLSHRWKNLWASVPNLKLLICSPKSDSTCSPGFVDRVLSSRGSSRIHRFHLNLYGAHKYFSHVDEWICTAITRNVVELHLLLFPNPWQRYELPSTLFMCKTLVILKLMLQFDIVAIPPNSDCFPNLKFLHVSVCFPDADSMKKLFSCCPALEDLIIDGNVEKIPGEADSVLRLNVSAPKLKILQISLMGSWMRNVSITVNAPQLETLDLMENFFATYSLKNAKSLSKAKVDVQVYRRYHADPGIDYAHRTHRLFAGIINVKSLSLAAPILTNPCLEFQGPLPKFYNLNHLEVRLKTCSSWKSLTKLLEISPNLENLVFENNIECHADHDKNDQWCQPETLPICLFSSLKTVCVRGFRWHSDEMEAVKYMLKHGEALNKVTVYARNISAEKQMEWQQEFVDFPRVSKTCQIELVQLIDRGF